MQEVETLIRQRPDQASLYQARGGVLYALKRYPEARADFERVLKTEPGNVQVIRSLYALDLRENKRDAARERLKKALAAQPDNGDLLVAAAEDALLDNRLADAATLARRATKVKPSALEPQNILIREALAAGRTRQALEIATAYAERHPGQPLAALLLANTRLTAGEPLLALSSYNDLLKKQPANPLLNLLQARALLALGRQGEARSALKRVLVRLPDNYDALAMLAGIEASSGDEAAVKRILDQLDRLHPGSGLIAALRADLAFQMRRYEQALALYQKINATRPRPELQLRIAQSLARLGRGQEADRLLAEAVNKQPGAQVLRQAYADRLIALGKQAEAIRHYEYLIRIQPNSPLALNNLASLLQENQPERALKLATQAYELAPNVPAFADTYGWALTRAGRHEQSLNPLLRARDKLPADPAVRYHLAAALAELGRTKDARAELAVALAAPQPFSERAAAETLAKRLKTAK